MNIYAYLSRSDSRIISNFDKNGSNSDEEKESSVQSSSPLASPIPWLDSITSNHYVKDDDDIPIGLQKMRIRMKYQQANEERMKLAIEKASREAALIRRKKYEKIRKQGAKIRAKMQRELAIKSLEGAEKNLSSTLKDEKKNSISDHVGVSPIDKSGENYKKLSNVTNVGTIKHDADNWNASQLQEKLISLSRMQRNQAVILERAAEVISGMNSQINESWLESTENISSENSQIRQKAIPISEINGFRLKSNCESEVNIDEENSQNNITKLNKECDALYLRIPKLQKILQSTEGSLNSLNKSSDPTKKSIHDQKEEIFSTRNAILENEPSMKTSTSNRGNPRNKKIKVGRSSGGPLRNIPNGDNAH